jgi:protein-disulfide isomerase
MPGGRAGLLSGQPIGLRHYRGLSRRLGVAVTLGGSVTMLDAAKVAKLAFLAIACAVLVSPAAGAIQTVAPGSQAAGAKTPAIRNTASTDRHRTVLAGWERIPSEESGGSPSEGSQGAAGNSAPMEPTVGPMGHPELGPDSAPVTIIEYTDFQCPYCRRVESVLDQVRAKYGNKVRIVHMDFPLRIHARAMDAALAARCAQEQHRFWAYRDALFSNQSRLSSTDLKALARRLGLDGKSFDSCLDGREYLDVVQADMAEGERVGVKGTPYFFINDETIDGAAPFSAFKLIINSELVIEAQKPARSSSGQRPAGR